MRIIVLYRQPAAIVVYQEALFFHCEVSTGSTAQSRHFIVSSSQTTVNPSDNSVHCKRIITILYAAFAILLSTHCSTHSEITKHTPRLV